MSDHEEYEGEIEFLDEDAEIVQQCVQNVDNDATVIYVVDPDSQADSSRMLNNLLVQRDDKKQERSKRKRKDDDDSDYDPMADILATQNRHRKRRLTAPQNVPPIIREELALKPQIIKKDPFDPKMNLGARRKLQLRVPDYDDPLCLPVRALRKDADEIRKLRIWNNMCLEHFKNYDTLLRVEKQPSIGSKKTVVLRNVNNKKNGKVETTVSAKLCVENRNGERRTEAIQAVLPKYREKKLLNIRLTDPKKSRVFYTKDEVILTKEVHKEEESLVVYKPMESLSLVYKMFDNKSDERKPEPEEEDRKYLKEVASCKMCAPCFQSSWRAYKPTSNRKIFCMICKRPCISIYNLLAHMKSHSKTDVQACKKEITHCLASAVEYHYKCRICYQMFDSIKTLRVHVKKHKGTGTFKCEICNRITS